MSSLPSLDALVEHLKRLPGVGQKSAERMAQALLTFDKQTLSEISSAISELPLKIKNCSICGVYAEGDICEYCKDPTRTSETLIVVSYPKDIYGFAKLQNYTGRFFVLGGELSPSRNKGVDTLALTKLEELITTKSVKEIILATNPSVEGEFTALYVSKRLSNIDVKVTRLGYGLPMGGQVDYADALTLLKAVEGRKAI